MLKIKEHLFNALVACLEHLGEGLGAKAAFESPKMASHGDLAVTAALSLSKALKTNPRDLALRLKEALSQTPACQEGPKHRDCRTWFFEFNIEAKRQASDRERGLDSIESLWRKAPKGVSRVGGVRVCQSNRTFACGACQAGRTWRCAVQLV